MFSTSPKDGANAGAVNLTHHDHELREQLVEAADHAGRRVRSIFNSASDEVEHVGDRVSAEIRTNPLRSTAIALGVGAVLGMLFRR